MVLFDRTQKNPKKASLSIPWPNSPGPQRATSVLFFPDQCYWGLLGGNSNSNMFKHFLHVSPPKNWGKIYRFSNLTISYFFPNPNGLGEKKKQPTPNGKVMMTTRKSWNGEKRPKRSKPWSPFSKQFMDILKLLRFSFKLLWHCINYCTPRRVEQNFEEWGCFKKWFMCEKHELVYWCLMI